jgi:hypothetical protein
MGARAAKRAERRQAFILDEDDGGASEEEAIRGECRHGCNGWPCGSERCTFTCHEGLPVTACE